MSSSRLFALQAADPGFFILALHSRAEALMRTALGSRVNDRTTFRDLVDDYFDFQQTQPAPAGRVYFDKWRLINEHLLTNQVRHWFAEYGEDSAKAAAYNFWSFLGYTGHRGEAEFREIPTLFSDWNNKAWTMIPSPELEALQARAADQEHKARGLLNQYDDMLKYEALATKLEAELHRTKQEADALKAKLRDKDQAFDNKRQEIRTLEKTIRENSQQLGQLAELRGYLDTLVRLTALTRTRRAFEEQVLRLTPEQKALAENLPLNHETLIRGGAGTGKSLVLLKLVQRILTPPQQALDFGKAAPTVQLLTYTRALTKYGTYLTSLLGVELDTVEVKTADAVLVEFSRMLLGVTVEFQWVSRPDLKRLIETSGLKENEFQAECDQLIWGWNLSWEEYRTIDRVGFKKPLQEPQRLAVWKAQEAVVKVLETAKRLPSTLAAQRLWEQRHTWTDRQVDYVLVDEAQDLHPVRLRFFHSLARIGFVLAADEGQNLNQSKSPFKRAGLEFSGHAKILRTNFRNTVATEETAGHFYDGEAPRGAFRHGPAPEWFFASNTEPLLNQMMAKIRILLGELRYEPENILLIHSGDRSGLEKRLSAEELPFQDIKNDSFSFKTTGQLRLSTFASAKGLDSPVVLVLWNNVFPFPGWSEEATERQQRNFVYVALTRGLEHVHLFVREDDSAIVGTMKAASHKKE